MFTLAALGLLLVGMGLSFLGHAIEVKIKGASTLVWVVWGTVALVVTNTGLALFGEAVVRGVVRGG